jgi:hypothetical protein
MLDIDKFMLSRLMVNLCETTANWREGFTKSGIKSLFMVNSRKKSTGVYTLMLFEWKSTNAECKYAAPEAG